MINKKTAILIDGGFFLKRYNTINKLTNPDPIKTAKGLWDMCIKGHCDIKTTMIYAQLMEKTKVDEMKKWDNS